MQKFSFKSLLFPVFLFLFQALGAQTLIINEVSNGPSGNKEYVELVVVSNTVTYDCGNSTPPCIDIRGWIFDDNSGYHGGSGVAGGAVRFSHNSLWSCVPVGTIILLYNDADVNPAIPATDLSMADGNCRIVAPISNASLFESNSTTPGAIACSYPASGWTAGGSWNNTLFANAGDCARIVNLSGCEVFSVCWGSDNQNNLIYFSGAGGQKVWYFNNVNPALQSNWTSGNASATPGSQTPGAPNNAANAAYIAQFNNGCVPIMPMHVTVTSVNAGCTCNGSATATASGSIGGYTYAWYDAGFNPIGQTGSTATGLCAGVYNVIATSHINCADTATVTVTSSSISAVAVNSSSVCTGNAATLTATPSTTGGTYLWMPDGQSTQTISVNPASTTTYTVTYTLGGCSSTAIGTITVSPQPTIIVNSPTICSGVTATLTATGAAGYSWNTGASVDSIVVNPSLTTSYTVTGTTSGCSGTAVSTVTVIPSPTISVNSPAICSGTSVTLIATGGTSYSWSTGATTDSIVVNPSSTTSYTVTETISGCTGTAVSAVTVTPLPVITVNSPTICSGATVTLTATGAAGYSWNTGVSVDSIIVNPSATTSYTVTGTTNGCSGSAVSTVTVNTVPVTTVNSVVICAGDTAILTAGGASEYAWTAGADSITVNTAIASPVTSASYTVMGISSGCSSTAVASVTVNPVPAVTVNSPVICPGATASLIANGAAAYVWSAGATPTGINTASALPAVTTTYTVTGTSSGCTSTAIATVTVSSGFIADAGPDHTICPGNNITLTATPTGAGHSYSWLPAVTGSGSSVLAAPAATTTYTVTVTDGCSIAVDSVTVFVSAQPVVDFVADKISGCAPLCVNFSDRSTVTGDNIHTWTWLIDGVTYNSADPAHCFTAPGSYDIGLTVGAVLNGCVASYTNIGMITVFDTPQADFISPQTTSVATPVAFTDNSTNAVNWSWSFGDAFDADSTSFLQDAVHAYPETGYYCVTLAVTSANGCADTTQHCLTVINEEFTFYAPNAFSPNGNTLNDLFLPKGTGWKEDTYELSIFDRWGNRCFYTRDVNEGWNGKANKGAEIAQIEAYTWKVELRDLSGRPHSYIGLVTIVK